MFGNHQFCLLIKGVFVNKQTLIKGSLILAASSIIARFVGIFFRIPMDYLVGPQGMGIYYYPYPLYDTMMALSSVGLSVALSKLVSERLEAGEKLEAYRSFKIALLIFGVMGFGMTLVFAGLAYQIAGFFNWPEETVYALWGLSLAPVLVTAMSTLRGLFQGYQNTVPTGISMIIEQIGRVIIGLGLAWFLLKETGSLGLAVGGATFGASAGAFLGLSYLGNYWYRNRTSIRPAPGSGKVSMDLDAIVSRSRILLKWMIPITVCSLISTLAATLDSATLRLFLDGIMDPDLIDQTNGALGRVTTIINVPIVISAAITASLVPLISACYVKQDIAAASKAIARGFKLAMVLTIPCVGALVFFPAQVIGLIYSSALGADIMRVYALTLIFSILSNLLLNISIVLNQTRIPMLSMGVGVLVKIAANYLACRVFGLGFVGAAYASVLMYAVILTMNVVAIRKIFPFSLDLKAVFLKPALSTAVMVTACYGVYSLAVLALGAGRLSTVLMIMGGVGVYPLLLLLLKGLTPEEVSEFPGGKRLAGWMNGRR